MKVSCIYKITNTQNNKIYIGSAICFRNRKSDHLSRLKKGYHYNIYLQRSFYKYGINSFTFEILEECNPENLLTREQYYIDTLKPDYNICKIAGSNLGRKFSEEAKAKMSKSRTGKKRSLYAIEKTRTANKKSIVQLTRDGEIVKIWDSCISASKELNINKAHITGCCKFKIKSIGGFVWRYNS